MSDTGDAIGLSAPTPGLVGGETSTTQPVPTGPPVDNGTGLSDEQLHALLAWFQPTFGDMMMAAIAEADAAASKITVNSGTVVTVSVNDGTTSGGSATLTMDGDDTGGEVTAQIIGETPLPLDRVMVMFVPPAAAYVIGHVGGAGVPAGTISATVRNITAVAAGDGISAPDRGYFWPYGQVIKQSAAPNLNRVLGTRFNTGGEAADEVRLPDLRGRMLIGMDNMGGSDAGRHSLTNTVGTVGGQTSIIAHTHTMGNHTHSGPSHSHTVNSHTHTDSGHGHSDSGHTHSVTAWANGTSQVRNDAAGWSADSQSIGTSTGYANIGTGYASLSYESPGTDSQSGTTGTPSTNTTDSTGSGSEQLPPVMVVHWQIKG